MSDKINPAICPICGKENNCYNVKFGGGVENGCWCNSPDIVFPPELLAQVPPDKRRKACICKSCAEAFAVLSKREE